MGLRQKSQLKVNPLPQGADTPSPKIKETPPLSKARLAAVRVVSSDPVIASLCDLTGERTPVEVNDPSHNSTTTKVEGAKQALGKLECEIISALFPSSGNPQTFEQIAERLGMTIQEVRDLADNALRDLRGPAKVPGRVSTVWN